MLTLEREVWPHQYPALWRPIIYALTPQVSATGSSIGIVWEYAAFPEAHADIAANGLRMCGSGQVSGKDLQPATEVFKVEGIDLWWWGGGWRVKGQGREQEKGWHVPLAMVCVLLDCGGIARGLLLIFLTVCVFQTLWIMNGVSFTVICVGRFTD